MDEATAKSVISVGFLIGLVVWALGVRLSWKILGDVPSTEYIDSIKGKSPDEVISAIIAKSMPGSSLQRLDDQTLTAEQMGVAIRFEAARMFEGSTLSTTIDFARYRTNIARVMGGIVLVLAPLVLFGVSALLWLKVAPSPEPAVRWQTLQILQTIHVLWPPFLVYGLYKKFRKKIEGSVSDLALIVENS